MAKVREIYNFTLKEKEDLIISQNQQKGEVATRHALMAQAKAPEVGSEAHTISEHQMLLEQQEYWNREQSLFFANPSLFRMGVIFSPHYLECHNGT